MPGVRVRYRAQVKNLRNVLMNSCRSRVCASEAEGGERQLRQIATPSASKGVWLVQLGRIIAPSRAAIDAALGVELSTGGMFFAPFGYFVLHNYYSYVYTHTMLVGWMNVCVYACVFTTSRSRKRSAVSPVPIIIELENPMDHTCS